MLEICESGYKNDINHRQKLTLKSTLYSILNSTINETPKHYPTRLYGRLRDKPLSQLDDWEAHYILEQLLGGDGEK